MQNTNNKKSGAGGIIVGIIILVAVVKITSFIFPQLDSEKTQVCTSYETIKSINYVDGKFIAKTYGGYTFEVDNTKYKEGDSYCYGPYYVDKTSQNTAGTYTGGAF